jgi:hypothetical protein
VVGLNSARQPGRIVLFFPVFKEKSNNPRNDDRKAELRIIRDFADTLIREGKAKEFLVEHGFVKQTGGLTKRYGG